MRRNEALMVDRTMAERRLKVSNQTLDYLRDMLQTSEAELRKTGEELELFPQDYRAESGGKTLHSYAQDVCCR